MHKHFSKHRRADSGAIDLLSIMVGAIVMLVLAGVIAASVFVVIPWAQDNAAQQDLDAVRTAQGVAKTKETRFMDGAGLRSTGLLTDQPPRIAIAADSAGTCWLAASRSQTGKTFWASDEKPTAQTEKPATCASADLTAPGASEFELAAGAPKVNASLVNFEANGDTAEFFGEVWSSAVLTDLDAGVDYVKIKDFAVTIVFSEPVEITSSVLKPKTTDGGTTWVLTPRSMGAGEFSDLEFMDFFTGKTASGDSAQGITARVTFSSSNATTPAPFTKTL